ncbi:MAG: hypothetical protein AAF368_13435, partial [Planctomycetota bacterium]
MQEILCTIAAVIDGIHGALADSPIEVDVAVTQRHRTDLESELPDRVAKLERGRRFFVRYELGSAQDLEDCLRSERAAGEVPGYDIIVPCLHGVDEGALESGAVAQFADALAMGWSEGASGRIPIAESSTDPRRSLVEMLTGTRTRSIFLLACHVRSPLARALLHEVVDHVVGVRTAVPLNAAGTMAESLFASLREGRDLGEAVCDARRALSEKGHAAACFLTHWTATRDDLRFPTPLESLERTIRDRYRNALSRFEDKDPIGRTASGRSSDLTVEMDVRKDQDRQPVTAD